VAGLAGNVLVLPWVGRRQPSSNILLQLVAYQMISAIPVSNPNINKWLTF
jgi:hypothetical protein